MLYSHALESIFGCCSLKELAALMAVCRSWQSSVLRMRPIEGCRCIYSGAAVEKICASPLKRHVAHVTRDLFYTVRLELVPFNLLTQSLPHLLSLCLDVTCDGTVPLLFPAHLRTLSLRIVCDMAAFLEATMVQIAQLAELTSLALDYPMRSLSLAPLLALPQLRMLNLASMGWLGDANMEVLRHMGQLHELRLKTEAAWDQLLAPGHCLQLQRFERYECSRELCDLLVTLPSLTWIDLQGCECWDIDFLASLPQLQHLELVLSDSHEVDAPEAVEALRQCTQLTQLTVSSYHLHEDEESGDYTAKCAVFDGEGLRECVQSMPLLRYLDVGAARNIPSLSFLASGPITNTLTDLWLHLFEPRLPISELQHIQQLRALERLTLFDVFERQLTVEEAGVYTPPSLLMPALREFDLVD